MYDCGVGSSHRINGPTCRDACFGPVDWVHDDVLTAHSQKFWELRCSSRKIN